MTSRFILSILLSSQILISYAQVKPLIITPAIVLPKDSTTKKQLITSLNGFLSQKEKPNDENTFVLKEDILATAVLLDEIKGIEKSAKYKDDNFYKGYLLNAVPLNETTFVVQFGYVGMADSIPIVRANFRALASRKDNQFYFSSPLKQSTALWKSKQVGNCTFYFKNTINTTRAKELEKLIASFDKRLGATNQQITYYCCDDFTEVLQVTGVDYKSNYNSYRDNSLSTHIGNNTLAVNGVATSEFKTFDAHDLFHARLHNILSVDIINRPVDEGCAYLYGGSWGISWEQILKTFKEKVASNPKADWLTLYNDLYIFNDNKEKPLTASYVINALIIQKIEKDKGFPAVIELLSCGKYEKNNDNYFNALEKVTGISKATFNERVGELLGR